MIKIIGEMFTGIITDRFGNLREKLGEIEEDQKENCFICGKSIEEVEKENQNFKWHIEEYHNMWNYVIFIDYLKQKN